MALCAKCGNDVCKPCVAAGVPANDNDAPVLWIAPDRRLRRVSHACDLARHLAALGLSRRELGNWLAETVFSFLARGGVILALDGKPFEIGESDIDDAFNNDGSWRWMGCFLAWASTPPKQSPQGRTLARLRLIDLAVRIDRMNRNARPHP